MRKTIFRTFNIFCISFCFLLSANLSATTIYVSPSGDDTNDGLTSETAVKTICKALSMAVANDVIKVNGFLNMSDEPSKAESARGNIKLDGSSVYTTEAGITYNTWNPVVANGSNIGKVGIMMLNKKMTIEGTDPLTDGFDGDHASTIFRIDGCAIGLTFKNLTFKNGDSKPYGDGAAGLYIRSTSASFENCIFTNNKNTGVGNNGGAAVVYAANVIFTGCKFTDNYNAFGSALVFQAGNLTIDECIFENHDATSVNNSKGTIQFGGNGSGSVGNLLVMSSYFINNKIAAGSAICIQDQAGATLNARIESCVFEGNLATVNGGGAIFLSAANSNTTTVAIANSTFYNNSLSANEGSVLFVQNGVVGNKFNLTNCTITGNKSGNNANGAIRFAANSQDMEKGIYNCIIEGNSTTAGAYKDMTWQNSGGKDAAANLTIKNSFIGIADGTNVNENNYSGNYIGYYAADGSKAGLDAYNTEKHYFPLSANSPAIAFGNAKYLRDDLGIITDQLGQIRTFTGDKCAIGSYEVSIKPDGFADTYQHFILYGQSHSEGAGSYPALSTANVEGNYMLGLNVWPSAQVSLAGRTDFQPMIATEPPVSETTIVFHRRGENPVVGIVNHIQNKTKGTEAESSMLGTSSGVGGQIIEQLNKGSVLANHYVTNFLDVLNRTKAVAKPKKIKLLVPAIFWMQGESNSQNQSGRATTTDEYKTLLLALKNDMQNDIMSIYDKQETKPVFITYQMSGMFTGDFRDLPIARAHVELADEEEDIICAGPLYPVTHHTVNDTHLDANGYRWYGEMFGKVYYKTQILKEEFKPLQPIAFSATSNPKEVKVQFHVPEPPLAFDDKTLAKIPNYGFEIYFAGSSARKTIVSERIEGDCVILTLAENLPATGNIEVIYAGQNSGYRFGNLRDSDPYQAFYTYKDLDEKNENGQYLYPRENDTNGQPKSIRPAYEPKDADGNVLYNRPYPLYNFCVAFYQKIDVADLRAGLSIANNQVKDKKPLVFVNGVDLMVHSGSAPIKGIEIIDLAGKTVKTIDGAITSGVYPLSTLLQGVYIVRTTTASGTYTAKIIR